MTKETKETVETRITKETKVTGGMQETKESNMAKPAKPRKQRRRQVLPPGCTLSQLYSLWAEAVRYQVKPSSYALYITLIEKHILPYLGHFRVEELDNGILEDYIWERQEQELSWNTMRLIIFLLKGMIQAGQEKGVDPAEKLHYYLPKSKRTYMRVFGQQDTERLLRHLENSEEIFETGLLLSVFTGIRVGELCGLKWEDVDLAKGVLRINRTVSRIRNPEADGAFGERGDTAEKEGLSKTVVYIGTPKTGTSIREIPLPDFLILKLLPYKKSGECYVLTGTRKCMEPRGGQRRFKNLLRRCNIPDINIHSLRHAFASKWIENGFDSKALSEILGHSSIKITMDVYVHTNMEQKKSYMNRMV